jgi:peptidoglycan/xylan/chitin deacetylase (PgdA/CDA1 family)
MTRSRERSQAIPTEQRIACFTLDLEADYDGLVGGDELLTGKADEVERAISHLDALGLPVSTFVRTDLLPGSDHSHTVRDGRSGQQILQARQAFADHFGRPPVGYRAPWGILHPGDVELLAASGYGFSSSVTPALVPSWYDNRRLPTGPFVHPSGLMELPLATVRGLRAPLNLNWARLYGLRATRALLAAAGLPRVVVVNFHLHDLVPADRSFARLPWRYRLVLGRTRRGGMAALDLLVGFLRDRGYRLTTIGELYSCLRQPG